MLSKWLAQIVKLSIFLVISLNNPLLATATSNQAVAQSASLQKRIKEMHDEDQEVTSRWINADDAMKNEIGIAMINVRRKQNKELKEIIKQYGWPGYQLVGHESSEEMWSLVQHQDKDIEFQKECLVLLKTAVDAKEAPFKNFAFLLDRVRMNEGQPQIYGTQWIVKKGEVALYPVEDMDSIDQKRSEAGLPSLAEYKDQLKEVYHFSDTDFK